MYVSVRGIPRGTGIRSRVPRVVVVLGMVSLITDVSTEMVTAVLPIYATLVLGLTPLAYGMLDGLYQGATVLVRLLGGFFADRLRRPKLVAGSGYAIGAAAKLLLLPVGGAGTLSAAVGMDRAGKGLRTAPRDVLIATAGPRDRLGRYFGVHRALDATGALLGPVVAFGLLALAPGDFDMVFVVSCCAAVLGVLLFVHHVPEHRAETEGGVSLRDVAALLRITGFRRLLCAAAVLSVATIGDGFLYLVLLRNESVTTRWFPLLFVCTSLVYLALAVPLGRVSDRYGRNRVFTAGYGLLLCAYLSAILTAGAAGAGLCLMFLGAYYAATDGVLPAAAAPLLPAELTATGISVVQAAVAGGRALGAVAFGAVWTAAEGATAVWTFAAVLAVALLTAVPMITRARDQRTEAR
ncbi:MULTISPECIES: MFS transporter [Actinomadura]|uniref:MFS transporter n=1 Tax=Actinomadura litoris TaxID=2678616 RepID=A0A7K1L922_9ACTN|nr:MULTISPECIES: MFS transporter [Actinomadura]MBT2210335.1 MFS transporter [Actinomadura sp. NEAU-AAG7]MUN40675.1 MFS transporter [Actinomadura litoris]